MDIFLLLIANIIPLYILIALGFISGRWMDVNLPPMATVAIYILGPIVSFGAIAKMDLEVDYFYLALTIFIASTLIGYLGYVLGKIIHRDNIANLVGMSSVTGNTMFFGLPIVIALIGLEWVGVFTILCLGTGFNQSGFGYYMGARGVTTLKGAIIKVLKLPVLHAFWLGLVYNLSGLSLPDTFLTYWEYAIGAWVIIGMMIIGVALSKQSKLEIDFKLMASMFTPKFILWPLAVFALILTDMHIFKAFSIEIYQMLAIIGSVPLAGNLVAYATTLNLHPERAAAAVLISTILAFITVPTAVLILQLLS